MTLSELIRPNPTKKYANKTPEPSATLRRDWEARIQVPGQLAGGMPGAPQASPKTIKSHRFPSNPKVFEPKSTGVRPPAAQATTEAQSHRGLCSRPPRPGVGQPARGNQSKSNQIKPLLFLPRMNTDRHGWGTGVRPPGAGRATRRG